jgi:hypothetical protein
MFDATQVQFVAGERKVYRSTPGVRRSFCPECGTPLTWEGNWGGRTSIELHLNTFDQSDTFVPDRHVFYAERLKWFEVADRLPRYLGSSVDVEPDYFGPMVEGGPK